MLTTSEQKVLAAWLSGHGNYRLATDADCDCADDIKGMRIGYGDPKSARPDYHPYIATGDFNGDGVVDFAVALIARKSREDVHLGCLQRSILECIRSAGLYQTWP